MRIRIITLPLILIILSALPYSCSEHRLHQKTGSARVKIIQVAPNDLAQVMVFTVDSDNQKILFIRDFYDKNKNRALLKKEINQYLDRLEKLIGRESTITYRRNNAGNLEIQSIK